MSKSNVWETGLLNLLFNNDDFTLVGDAGGLLGSVADGSLYVSLHTSDPGEAGDQTSNEASYTSYTRCGVTRNTAGFSVSGNAVENTAAVTFPEATGGSNTITHFGIGTAMTGAGKLLYSGALSSSLAVSTGITPEFAAGAMDITED